MTIKCRDIIAYMEELAPVELAEEWDNVGLLAGDGSQTVKKILTCLDVTPEVLSQAIDLGADMIISHHPLIFKPLKRINIQDQKGRLIYGLIRSNISVYSAHTNLDAAENGINDHLAKLLKLDNIRVLNKYSNGEKEYSLGRVGELEASLDIEQFIALLKSVLGIKNVRMVGKPEGAIRRVAVFSGSFDGDLSGVFREKADILVTGDLKYHTAMDMLDSGLCAVDAGHFGTERIAASYLADLLNRRFPGLEAICNTVESDPFIYG